MSESDHTSAVPRRRGMRPAMLFGGAVVGAAAIATGGALLTGALFTSQATVSGQTVGTAVVEIEAETSSSSAPIALTSMLPGDTEQTSLVLENTGTEGVYYTVRVPAADGSDPELETALSVKVTVGALSYEATLASWQDGALQIAQPLASEATQAVQVEVALPIDTDDAVQGKTAEFAVQFDAIQERNQPTPTQGWHAD